MFKGFYPKGFTFPYADKTSVLVPKEISDILSTAESVSGAPKRRSNFFKRKTQYTRVASTSFELGDFLGMGSSGVFDVFGRKDNLDTKYIERCYTNGYPDTKLAVKVRRTPLDEIVDSLAEFENMKRIAMMPKRGFIYSQPVEFSIDFDKKTRSYWSFITMTKLKGETLDSRVLRCGIEEEVCRILRSNVKQMLLDGLVHLDLSPNNVMVWESEEGNIVLGVIDFEYVLFDYDGIECSLERIGDRGLNPYRVCDFMDTALGLESGTKSSCVSKKRSRSELEQPTSAHSYQRSPISIESDDTTAVDGFTS